MAKQEQLRRATGKETSLELGHAALVLSCTAQERSRTKRAVLWVILLERVFQNPV